MVRAGSWKETLVGFGDFWLFGCFVCLVLICFDLPDLAVQVSRF